jgi:hypothetical protein
MEDKTMKDPWSFAPTRREVLVAVPALAAAVGVGGVGRTALAGCTGADHEQAARLSVAFLQGSEQWDHLRALTPTLEAVTEEMAVDEAALVPADQLISGDGGFATRGARVMVHGLLGEPSDRHPAMRIAARYRPFHDASYLAWGFDGSTACCSSPATEFTVPVDAAVGLQLSVEVQPRDAETDGIDLAVAEATLGLGIAPGQAKLRRGIYLMAWDMPAGASLPAWHRYRVIAERIETPEDGMPASRRFMLTDATGAARTLPAVMLSIDYADAADA